MKMVQNSIHATTVNKVGLFYPITPILPAVNHVTNNLITGPNYTYFIAQIELKFHFNPFISARIAILNSVLV